MQDARLAETRQSLRPMQQFEGGDNFDYYVDRKTGWRHCTEPHLQLHSGQLRNGKRVGAHGSLHHLRNGCDFGFLGNNSRKSTGCRQDTHSQDTFVQYSLFTSAERTLNALGLAQAQLQARFASIFVPENKFCHLVCHMSHPWLLSHTPFSMSTSSSSPT